MNYHNHFGLFERKICKVNFNFLIFRRINKVLESIFDDAWNIIEQREKQRIIDQSKFVSAQHTSSTLINVK